MKNSSQLPVTLKMKVEKPFYLEVNDHLILELNVCIDSDSEASCTVMFKPRTHRDLYSVFYHSVTKLSYLEHPQVVSML